MYAGALMHTVSGVSGDISVPGLGAVIAEFQRWTLKRREDNRPGELPTWDLHAVFRYHNDLFLKNDTLKKKMTLTLNQKTKILLCEWETFEVEGDRLIAKGVTQCPQK